MRAAIFSIMAVTATASLLIKARDLVHDYRNPFLRWTCALIALSALASFASIPAFMTFLETSTGVPAIWVIGPVTAGCAATRALLLLWTLAPDAASRKIKNSLLPYLVAGTAIVALTLAARGAAEHGDIARSQEAPETLWAALPQVRDAFLIYSAIAGLTYIDAAARLVRTVRLVDRRWLRRALWTCAVGAMLLLSYTLALGAYFVAYRLGARVSQLQSFSLLAGGLGAIAVSIGIGMPIIGPRWDRMLAYRRLYRLWVELRRAAPQVVLESPALSLLDAWNPWRLDFRLYRRVIEIHDGLLALRPYLDGGGTAVELGRQAGQQGSPVEIAALALQLRTAIQQKQHGRPDRGGQVVQLPQPFVGRGLDAELSYLVPLARAFANARAVGTRARKSSTSPNRI